MNSPAPGWLPDPTGRHEYRYWDGTRWSDDVSDGGVTSFDPIGGPAPQAGGYGTGAPVGGPAGGPAGTGYGGGDPGAYASGGYGAAPQKTGPSTGLLVGLGVLLAALVIGIVVIVSSQGDDDDDTATGNGGDTSGQTDSSDGGSGDGGGGTGDSGAITDVLADGMIAAGGGALTEDQAQCVAQAMVDELGTDRIIELGLDSSAASNPLGALTPDEQAAVITLVLDCVPADVLAQIGAEGG